MEPPEHVLELANACVAAVANALKVELDFTHETLPLLDHYAANAKGPRDEILGLVAPMCGAYFGEVVRRALGPMRWHAPSDDYGHFRLEHEQVFLHVNPVGIALEAVLEREAEGYGAHLGLLDRDRREVEHAVELFGDVQESDYYRFSVRYEVLEQAIGALLTKAGDQPGTVPHEAYEAAVRDEEERQLPN